LDGELAPGAQGNDRVIGPDDAGPEVDRTSPSRRPALCSASERCLLGVVLVLLEAVSEPVTGNQERQEETLEDLQRLRSSCRSSGSGGTCWPGGSSPDPRGRKVSGYRAELLGLLPSMRSVAWSIRVIPLVDKENRPPSKVRQQARSCAFSFEMTFHSVTPSSHRDQPILAKTQGSYRAVAG
jgi:hypothetical protein